METLTTEVSAKIEPELRAALAAEDRSAGSQDNRRR